MNLIERIEQLEAERDFLLARAGHAGMASFGGEGRWTGLSSNALVTIAFGGKDNSVPYDLGDLAACYRCVMRLPRHLLTDAVFDQLEVGERYVGKRYEVDEARQRANWPDNPRAALRAIGDTHDD